MAEESGARSHGSALTASRNLQARLRLVEAPYPGQFVQPVPSRRSFWRIALRTIPIIIALVSTGLLIYVVLGGSLPQIVQLVHGETSQGYQSQQKQVAQPAAQQTQQQLPVQSQQPVQQTQGQQATQQSWPPVAIGPQLAMPSDDVLLMLIQSSLIALNHANATGNYSVLRDLGAPGFQEQNTEERLSEAFINFRERALDLSPILLFQPLLFRKPELNSQGMLRVMGFFPTEPERVNFELMFQPVNGRWRLFGISVDTAPYRAPEGTSSGETPARTAPQAPTASQAPPAAKAAPPVPARAKAPSPPAQPSQAVKKANPERLAPKTDPDAGDRIEVPPAASAPQTLKRAPKAQDSFNPFSR